MSIEDNKAAARLFIARTVAGEIDPAMLADDLVFWNPTTGELPRQALLDAAAPLRRVFKRLDMIEDGITAEESRVAIEMHSDGEFTSGEAYANVYHFLLVFDGAGRIRRFHEHLDSARADPLLRAIGLLN